ncbi:hypothetical protein EVAR_79431_1 [Eumeta japonica]|uniref:Uncharacterized protein n=1 Tax=Eumeta variegata TaxID=151549 RepID=A0A4C1VGS3_EUMVA|nr:hypothetical protein EVAR_79431_1 [Eumeta japonica]
MVKKSNGHLHSEKEICKRSYYLAKCLRNSFAKKTIVIEVTFSEKNRSESECVISRSLRDAHTTCPPTTSSEARTQAPDNRGPSTRVDLKEVCYIVIDGDGGDCVEASRDT